MPVTMKEIARKLGVSIATVSRVLSGSEDSVSDEVRKTILEAADRLGYRPRRKTGRTIAFLIDSELFNLSSLFYSYIVSNVEKEVARRGYFFHFGAVQKEDLSLRRFGPKPSDLAGAVLVGTYDAELVLRLRSRNAPVVMVDYWLPTEDVDAVLVDNVDGIMRAGKHLSELGHRRVAYISGTIDGVSSQERRYGFRRAQASFQFEDEPSLEEECRESMSGGFEAMNRLLERHDEHPPTAVIAYNDMVALGAMDAIKQRGLSIPNDISIVGFDDISLSAEVAPPLTTVQVPKELMGTLAAETLFQVIDGKPHIARKILLQAHIVVRGSTAARPQSG
ncbi:MAG TPA: LacI family DNA-binding transcriptional regulator [Spirochaetia bacterium]|nr:LacI family DNA-binding transcriptional regulator [Spirochaetia bacterium]